MNCGDDVTLNAYSGNDMTVESTSNVPLNFKRNRIKNSCGESSLPDKQEDVDSKNRIISNEVNSNLDCGEIINGVCDDSSNLDNLSKENITPSDGRGYGNLRSLNHLSVTAKPEELTSISLVNLGLDSIEYDFTSFVNVVSIDLSKNNLSSLPNSLCSLESCTKLTLSCNKFKNAPDVLYKGLMFLRDLDISYNLLNEFHEMPYCLSFLVNLNISHNLLRSPPIWLIYNLPCSLKSLDMSFNPCFKEKLHTLFFEAFEEGVIATKILVLDVSNTCLFPTNENFLSLFTCLKTLRLSSKPNETSFFNSFYDLPLVSLKQMPLEELALENCCLSSLPQNIDKLFHLKTLDISSNLLQWLPEKFVNLECLSILHASRCKLIYLPKDMGQMTALTELWIPYNDISTLPDLSKCKQLKLVDLYENSFTEFPDTLKYHDLEALDISANYFCPNNYTQSKNGCTYESLKINLRQRNGSLCRLDLVKSDAGSLNESMSNHSQHLSKHWSDSSSNSDEDLYSDCSGGSQGREKEGGSPTTGKKATSLPTRFMDSESVEEESWDVDPNDSWDPNVYNQLKVWNSDDSLSLGRHRSSISHKENYFCPFRVRSNFYRSLHSHNYGEDVSGQFQDA